MADDWDGLRGKCLAVLRAACSAYLMAAEWVASKGKHLVVPMVDWMGLQWVGLWAVEKVIRLAVGSVSSEAADWVAAMAERLERTTAALMGTDWAASRGLMTVEKMDKRKAVLRGS